MIINGLVIIHTKGIILVSSDGLNVVNSAIRTNIQVFSSVKLCGSPTSQWIPAHAWTRFIILSVLQDG